MGESFAISRTSNGSYSNTMKFNLTDTIRNTVRERIPAKLNYNNIVNNNNNNSSPVDNHPLVKIFYDSNKSNINIKSQKFNNNINNSNNIDSSTNFNTFHSVNESNTLPITISVTQNKANNTPSIHSQRSNSNLSKTESETSNKSLDVFNNNSNNNSNNLNKSNTSSPKINNLNSPSYQPKSSLRPISQRTKLPIQQQQQQLDNSKPILMTRQISADAHVVYSQKLATTSHEILNTQNELNQSNSKQLKFKDNKLSTINPNLNNSINNNDNNNNNNNKPNLYKRRSKSFSHIRNNNNSNQNNETDSIKSFNPPNSVKSLRNILKDRSLNNPSSPYFNNLDNNKTLSSSPILSKPKSNQSKLSEQSFFTSKSLIQKSSSALFVGHSPPKLTLNHLLEDDSLLVDNINSIENTLSPISSSIESIKPKPRLKLIAPKTKEIISKFSTPDTPSISSLLHIASNNSQPSSTISKLETNNTSSSSAFSMISSNSQLSTPNSSLETKGIINSEFVASPLSSISLRAPGLLELISLENNNELELPDIKVIPYQLMNNPKELKLECKSMALDLIYWLDKLDHCFEETKVIEFFSKG
ncbi:hypothetical protein K502DRAFT_4713 [Neoconidiobolus thromboides FSU 785]|nr:hypothetical protein K502DRAFT_4713 [Neoconidiobolus thromboides FSU 785]